MRYQIQHIHLVLKDRPFYDPISYETLDGVYEQILLHVKKGQNCICLIDTHSNTHQYFCPQRIRGSVVEWRLPNIDEIGKDRVWLPYKSWLLKSYQSRPNQSAIDASLYS